MTILIKLAAWAGKPRASVIFVHGLGGHAYETWRSKPDDDSFWPLWLAQEVEGLAVYTLGYAAPPSNWLGTAMPLQDRARNLLERLFSESRLKDGPVTFVCHSLGGLLVKQIMLDLQLQKGSRPEAADLLERITQVVFLATPHTGSRHANWLDRLRFFAWPTSIARTLVANDPTLRAINVNYRGLAEERRDTLRHRIFYETQGTPIGVIVDEASADPGLPGFPPIPIDADHIKIAKPAGRTALQYLRTRDFLAEVPKPMEPATGYLSYPLPKIELEQPWNLIPKLIRIAALLLVCAIAYKGVQALITPIDGAKIEQKLDEQNAQLKAQSDLIRQLLAQSATKPLPGAERAIGEAVAAAGKGAAEGDERMKSALKLLQENKVAEAEQLFHAVAVDKEARAKQNRQEAASAYRNLGAIAGLRDPKRALEAYTKAMENDPEDLESLIWVASLELERGDVPKAETHFQQVLKLATSTNREWYIEWAKIGIGDVLVAQGNLPEALKAYRDGLAIRDRLAKSDPGHLGWQRDLTVSYDRIGDVLVAQGNLPEALKAYRDDLAISDRLAKSDPGHLGWQRDLTVSYDRIGDVLVAQGNLPEALKAYRDGLAIRDRLAQSDPGHLGWQRDLSVSYNKIGDVLVAQGNLPEALKAYRDGLAIRDRLAKSDPGNAGWQRDLAVSYAKLGAIYQKNKDKTKALGMLQQGLAIMLRMTQLSPDNAQWKNDVVWFERQITELKH